MWSRRIALLILKGYSAIKDWLLGEPRYVHIGVHGGMCAQEIMFR